MKKNLLVTACAVTILCNSLVFAGTPVLPQQGQKPKMAAKPTTKKMAAGSKMTTTTKRTVHTKKG